MALDATAVHALAYELNNLLTGGRIEKVSQSEKYQITFDLRANKINHKLLLSASSSYPRVHITSHSDMNPETPPMFCMLLRKRLIGGRIVSIEQIDTERIIKIVISAKDELGRSSEYYLYCEMMGRHSNIILTDIKNTIIDSVKRVGEDKSRVRQILPQLKYSLPPSQEKKDPFRLNRDDFYKILLGNINLSLIKALQNNILGLSSKTIEYLSLGIIDSNLPLSRLPEEMLLSLSEEMYDFYFALQNNKISFYAIYDEANIMIDFTLLNHDPSIKHKQYGSINNLIDDFYSERALRDNIAVRISSVKQSIKTQLDRSVRKREKFSAILDDEKNLEKYKLYGELITSYIYLINKGSDKAEIPNYYSQDGQTEAIPLDPKKSPAGNASLYYKKYKKLKTAIELAHSQIDETQKDIQYFDSMLHQIENCDSENLAIEIQTELLEGGYIKFSRKKTSRKLAPSKPHHFLSSDNYDIYVGRNNMQNDELTMRFARNDDIWLHTKDIPGSHVIIRQKNNTVSEIAIKEGAFLAAWFSKARNSSNIPVNFTAKKNIRKPNGSKPGYVIYLSNSTLYVTCSKESFAEFKQIVD